MISIHDPLHDLVVVTTLVKTGLKRLHKKV